MLIEVEHAGVVVRWPSGLSLLCSHDVAFWTWRGRWLRWVRVAEA